ncbi:hypothetical protein ACFVTY_31060 [Streptomyces sp. NPDC058067]|uniref:hypothetical protein n=1 Tax=Streptomyces sp. NPDC058067 TaxID=3346324 RepID=UPI0036F00806
MSDLTQLPDVGEQRPLGYWLKHLDGAIEESMGPLFATDGLNRRGWQVLNAISYAPITIAELDETLAAFPSPTSRPCARTSTGSSSAAGPTRLTTAPAGRHPP